MEVKMERGLFGRILFLGLQWKIDMGETLCLTHFDGSMQKLTA